MSETTAKLSIQIEAKVAEAKQAVEGLTKTVTGYGKESANASKQAAAAAQSQSKVARELAQAQKSFAEEGLRANGKLSTSMGQITAAVARLKDQTVAAGKKMTEATGKATESFSGLKEEVGGSVGVVAQLKEEWGKLATVLAGLAVLTTAAKKAIEFEDTLVDLQRAANTTKEETEELGKEFKGLARELGMSAVGVTNLAAAAAKTGVAKGDLLEFARVAATAAMNFDMIPEEAGEALAGLRKVLAIGVKDMEAFAGAINLLADNAATKEKDIIGVLGRSGGSAASFGLTAKQAAGLATAFLNVRATSETAATAIRTLTTRLSLGRTGTGKFGKALQSIVGDVDKFSTLMSTDAAGAIEVFLQAVRKMPLASRDFQLNELFGEGQDTDNIKKLANDVDELGRIMAIAGKSPEELVKSLRDLTALKLGTVASEMKMMDTAWSNAGESLGKIFLPAIRVVTVAIAAFGRALDFLASNLPGVTLLVVTFGGLAGIWKTVSTVGKIVTGVLGKLGIQLGGFAGVLATVKGFFGGLLGSLGTLWTTIRAGGGVVTVLKLGFKGLLGPIGLVITALTTLYDVWNIFAGGKDSGEKAIEARAKAFGGVSEALKGVSEAATQAKDQISIAMSQAVAPVAALTENYKVATEQIKATLDERLAAIDAKQKQELALIESSNQSQRDKINETARVAIEAEKSKVGAVDQYGADMIRAWERTYGRAEEIMAASGANDTKLAKEAIDAKIAIYQQMQGAYARVIDGLIAEEQRHVNAVRAAEDEKFRLKQSIEDRIRGLKQKTLSEEQAYADKVAQINEKLSLAQAEATKGNAENAKRYAEEAINMAERNANAVVKQVEQNGSKISQEVVTLEQATSTSMNQIEAGAKILNGELDKTIEQGNRMKDEASANLKETQGKYDQTYEQMVMLQAEAAKGAELKLSIDDEAAQQSIEAIKRLVAAEAVQLKLEADMTQAKATLDAWVADPGNTDVAVKAVLAQESLATTAAQLSVAMTEANLEAPVGLDYGPALKSMSELVGVLEETKTDSEHDVTPDMKRVNAAFEKLNNTVTKSIHYIVEKRIPAKASGGLIEKYAGGGLAKSWKRFTGKISGPGTGTSDSIFAKLSNGEFVIRAAMVKKFGASFFNALNSGFLPPMPRFATGGPVNVPVTGGSLGTMNVNFRVGDTEIPIQVAGPNAKQQVRTLVKQLNREKLVAGV